jgi:catechol 2,3-dioxygenase-like lactoylglutathione lyase family enzyme
MSQYPVRAKHQLTPTSRGVHHLALNTSDMKATTEFYMNVLGMPLVHALRVPPGVGVGPGNRGNPPFENLRHYFFDAGGDTLLAFFELPADEVGVGDRNSIASMQHVSFTTTQTQFEAMKARLNANQISFLGPVCVGVKTWSIYIFDPNGIRLEYSYQEDDPDDLKGVRVVERWTQTQEEILEELQTLEVDAKWLDAMTKHLPRERH